MRGKTSGRISDTAREGFTRSGLGPGSRIEAPDNPDPAERTALEELRRFLDGAPGSGDNPVRRVLLGRTGNNEGIRKLDAAGAIRISGVSPEDDGFHVRRAGDAVTVAGANPRAVLHAVYALEEYVEGGAEGPLDIRVVPWFRKRCGAIGYYWNRYVNLDNSEFTQETAEYLARLGVNELTCTGGTRDGYLFQLVKSDVFPFQAPPDEEYRRKVRSISAICRKYGIDYIQWIFEPILPCLAAPAEAYPPSALGTARLPWGGSPEGDTTLCVTSPLVREHYRDMMRRFAREFPDAAGVVFYNLDQGAWLCTPGLCPRCAAAAAGSPPDRYNPWETQADFVTLLAGAAQEERPGFRFIFWGSVHFEGENVGKLLRRAHGYDAVLTTWTGSDRDLFISEAIKPGMESLISQEIARGKGIPAYFYAELNRLECIQQGFPYPYHVCDTLRRLCGRDVRHIMEGGGPIPAHNAVNALAAREFLRDPLRDPGLFLRDLARRILGAAAGEYAHRAWEEIRDAFCVWDGYRLHPLSGSQPYLSLGTIGGLPLPILPGIEDAFEEDLRIRTNVEPWRASEYARLKEPGFLTDLGRMEARLARAERFARRAARKAGPGEYAGVCLYRGSPEGLGRPTRREWALREHAAVALALSLLRQRTHIVRAARLLRAIKSGQTGLRREYARLVRRDIALQRNFLRLLARLRERRPCLALTGITQREIEDFIRGTREKTGRLSAYLRTMKWNESSDLEQNP